MKVVYGTSILTRMDTEIILSQAQGKEILEFVLTPSEMDEFLTQLGLRGESKKVIYHYNIYPVRMRTVKEIKDD